ncbi:unnamed protein product [Arabidopsis lyrata]|uniref:Uncharacterized protein n=1 Tax=Arabidopsis lyrata subsp. lyrata TaxID=81972 RepID=D7MK15_ARALL|nr:uncharacterized protein LOC9304863 [Arabidopsis lyrata subsp. lyrata]EFH47111.1 hypothetical protein ARALYDRAFT_494151 [Arabidopsis lyrata subsp. lyrata]CAH8277385.1 unnamed protein product [Arabidopsis lyrata]|eukprot:XP_002870852.1 uncharacterized protein LOC9304863 [Arabidopsis lyrata subsp. lyrata]
MADIISNPAMEQLFFSVDPMSLILSQNSDTHQLKLLLDGFSGFERGPRYDEYSRLRESKLRMKRDFQKFLEEEDEEEEPRIKKQVRFEGNSVISQEDKFSPEKKKQSRFEGNSVISPEEDKFTPEKKKQSRFGFSPMRKAVPSSLAQSVPDFSAVIRKENRRPVNFNTTTPPPPTSKSKNGGVLSGSASRGSKSASAGEKKSKGMMMGIGMARKSYANVEDLKKISMAAASAINGGGGGGGGRKVGEGGGGRRTILGYRQIY